MLETYKKTAKCHAELGQHKKALQIMHQAFMLVEPHKKEGRGEFFYARLCFTQATLHERYGEKELAEEYYKKLIEISEKVLPPSNVYSSIAKGKLVRLFA